MIDKQSFYLRVDVKEDKDSCWEWKGCLSHGYGRFKFKTKLYLSHRAAYILEHGEIPDGLFICHKCDNRKCCNPNHLFAGTQSENMIDCVAKGRLVYPVGQRFKNGDTPANKKTSDDIVLQIKQRLSEGVRIIAVAKEFNEKVHFIQEISANRTYKHVILTI